MSPQPTILIVDDEKHTRDGLRRLLEDEYDTYVAEDIRGAMDVLEREPINMLLTDLRLGGDDDMALIERALKLPHPPICIMMTAYGTVDTAVEAMKRGAYDFVTKPLNLDQVEMLIARALASRKMEQENRTLRQQVDERYGLENIIGESPILREVSEALHAVSSRGWRSAPRDLSSAQSPPRSAPHDQRDTRGLSRKRFLRPRGPSACFASLGMTPLH